MKKIIFTFLSLLILIQVSSQITTKDISFGEEFVPAKNKRIFYDQILLGSTDKSIYYSNWDRNHTKQYSLYEINKDLQLEKEILINWKDGKYPILFKEVINFQNKDLLIAYSHNKKKNLINLKCVDLSKGIEENNLKDFYSFDYDDNTWMIGFSKKNYDSEGFKMSRNKRFLAFCHSVNLHKKGNKKQFQLAVFDENAQIVFEKLIEIKYDEKQFFVWDFEIDNNGQVYILAKESSDFTTIDEIQVKFNDLFKKTDKAHYGHLYKVSQSQDLEEIETKLEGKDFLEGSLFMSQEDELFFVGTCSDKTPSLFFTKYSSTGEMKLHKDYQLDPEKTLPEIIKKGRERNSKKKRNSKKEESMKAMFLPYRFTNLLIDEEDQSFYFVAEYQYKKKGTGKNAPDRFATDDLLVGKMTFSGEQEWMTKIPKEFHTQGGMSAYSSYTSNIFGFNAQKELVFFYNTFKKDQLKGMNKLLNEKHSKIGFDKTVISSESGETINTETLFLDGEFGDFSLEVNNSFFDKRSLNVYFLFKKLVLFKKPKAKLGSLSLSK
ncbi:MAG: hypothetical protein AB8F94_02795 [Saprospiraceae bacterium]